MVAVGTGGVRSTKEAISASTSLGVNRAMSPLSAVCQDTKSVASFTAASLNSEKHVQIN